MIRLLKTELSRFFAIGFAAGAILVFTVLDPNAGVDLANNVVPPAAAAPAQ